MMVHPVVPNILRRLAAHHGETQAAVLERLLQSADADVARSINSSRELGAYLAAGDVDR
jgi:hypothetical protein